VTVGRSQLARLEGYAALEELDASQGQLSFCLDWGREPWQGYAPRVLTTHEKGPRFSEPATVEENFTDPAQVEMWVRGPEDPLLQQGG